MLIYILILNLLVLLLILRLLRVQKKIRKKVNQNEVLYEQTESLIKLHNVVRFNYPLPPMRVWAISPDIALILYNEIIKGKPDVVIDFGSGTSTLISAYSQATYKDKCPRIYSFDHDAEFSTKTKQLLNLHNIDSFVKVYHTPLETIELRNETFQFYNVSALDEVDSIDLVFIDGPHGKRGILDRYPALPLVYDKLSKNAVIIVDDAKNFKESSRLIEMWRMDFPQFEFEMLDTELGTVIFRKK
jgi:predicted O-methyltransferase YrrM